MAGQINLTRVARGSAKQKPSRQREASDLASRAAGEAQSFDYLLFSRSAPCGQFLNRWLVECVKPAVRPLTLQQYQQHVKLFLGPALGSHRLEKRVPVQVGAYAETRN